jgi:hypothetical protein
VGKGTEQGALHGLQRRAATPLTGKILSPCYGVTCLARGPLRFVKVHTAGDREARNKIILLDVAPVVATALYILHTSSHCNLGKHPHHTGFAPCRSDSISTTTKVLVCQTEVKLKRSALPAQGIYKGSLTCRSCSIAGIQKNICYQMTKWSGTAWIVSITL